MWYKTLLPTPGTALNLVIEDVKGPHEMALINQALPALESAINSVLHTNKCEGGGGVDKKASVGSD